MKLNEKGLKKIQRWQDAKRLGYAYPIDEIEFELDDFKVSVKQDETKTFDITKGMDLDRTYSNNLKKLIKKAAKRNV
jgi:hypothetical protein